MQSKLFWNVYIYSFNEKKIITYDIFSHASFLDDLKKLKKKKPTFDVFKEEIRKLLMYYFWSKCEWEIILSAWPPSTDRKEEKKIDVYDQVMLNFDAFCKYVWESLFTKNSNKTA